MGMHIAHARRGRKRRRGGLVFCAVRHDVGGGIPQHTPQNPDVFGGSKLIPQTQQAVIAEEFVTLWDLGGTWGDWIKTDPPQVNCLYLLSFLRIGGTGGTKYKS